MLDRSKGIRSDFEPPINGGRDEIFEFLSRMLDEIAEMSMARIRDIIMAYMSGNSPERIIDSMGVIWKAAYDTIDAIANLNPSLKTDHSIIIFKHFHPLQQLSEYDYPLNLPSSLNHLNYLRVSQESLDEGVSQDS